LNAPLVKAAKSGSNILNRNSNSAGCPSALLGVRQYISTLLAPAGASGPNADATLGQLRLAACAIAALADIYICYRLARPVPGIGIVLPGFAAAAVAVGTSWLLLSGPAELPFRPPVAFVAGVLGPLVGADPGGE
jgi:hypothetical protein